MYSTYVYIYIMYLGICISSQPWCLCTEGYEVERALGAEMFCPGSGPGPWENLSAGFRSFDAQHTGGVATPDMTHDMTYDI